jgi:hypothetical protein
VDEARGGDEGRRALAAGEELGECHNRGSVRRRLFYRL